MKNRQALISNVKKNPQLQQQLGRGSQQQQMTTMNKPHINQQMPMVQNNAIAPDLVNQINKTINDANQGIQNITSFMPMSINHQNVMAASRIHPQYMNMVLNNNRNKIPTNMLHLAEKQVQ